MGQIFCRIWGVGAVQLFPAVVLSFCSGHFIHDPIPWWLGTARADLGRFFGCADVEMNIFRSLIWGEKKKKKRQNWLEPEPAPVVTFIPHEEVRGKVIPMEFCRKIKLTP